MDTKARNAEPAEEANPGCLEYAVIIALLIPTVIVLLVLGKFSPEKAEQLRQKFGIADENE